jgi:hypothetical protein
MIAFVIKPLATNLSPCLLGVNTHVKCPSRSFRLEKNRFYCVSFLFVISHYNFNQT